MSDETYQNFLHDLTLELLEKSKDPSIFEPNDQFKSGYRAALYSVLHLMEVQVETWGLDRAGIGLGDFSADAWRKTGINYWKGAAKD